MAYGVHVERKGAPIPLTEWLDAVAQTPNVRLFSSPVHRIENPVTGEAIEAPANSGDAEIFVNGTWRHALRFSEGRATARASAGFDNPADPLRTALRALAAALKARIRGNEGEVYD